MARGRSRPERAYAAYYAGIDAIELLPQQALHLQPVVIGLIGRTLFLALLSRQGIGNEEDAFHGSELLRDPNLSPRDKGRKLISGCKVAKFLVRLGEISNCQAV